ncbi:MAG: amidase [Leptothrix sp. (in: Bacteria)]|nr:amidase [Leptothrix sp. (in: b-proteobacteria)]
MAVSEGGLHALSAVEMHQAFAAGALSPLDVARAVVAQVERWEPHLHATWDFDAEEALAMARASEARWRVGAALGPMDGVPLTIKENIATRGRAMPLGTAAGVLVAARTDAPPAARLREAGAVFVARTTMPDYGMLSSGLSSFHALTRNPWNLACNPGGSSAGAAAAAAAGYGPLHLGTDIGGSIRLPAGWCGVAGFKPSAGRVPIHPPYTGRVAGPLAREVADVALVMATLSQPDVRDGTRLPPQAIAWRDLGDEQEPRDILRGLRVGLLLDAGWGLAPEPAIVAAVQAAARTLEAAGAIVEPLPAFTTREMADGINLFWRMRSWLEISALPRERQARVLPYIRAWVAEGAHFTATQVFRGQAQMAALRDAALAACEPFDAVLSPVAPLPAFDATHASPTNDPLRAMEHIAFTLPANMSGQPAISVPCGQVASEHDAAAPRGTRPVGLQITGRLHDDLGVLRVARAFERLRPPQPPWPQPPR